MDKTAPKRTKLRHCAPRKNSQKPRTSSHTRPLVLLCFASCIPCRVFRWKKKKRVWQTRWDFASSLLLSSGRHAKFPRGRQLRATSVYSSTNRAVKRPQVSVGLTERLKTFRLIQCPLLGVGLLRKDTANEENKDGEIVHLCTRPVWMIWACSGVSVCERGAVCPVKVNPLLSRAVPREGDALRRRIRRRGDLSRVSTGRKLREAPPR